MRQRAHRSAVVISVVRVGRRLTGGRPTCVSFLPCDYQDKRLEAYAELDSIAEKLDRDDLPEDTLDLYVVDEQRQPVPRPGAH